MNKIIRYISFFVLLTAYGCNNEFLDENLTSTTTPAGESEIFISASWEERSYHFSCPNMGNADFEIVKKPDWLEITTLSGKLNNGIAKISCKAKENSAYSKVGIYMDKMVVNAGGKTFWIPISYITEGNPKINVNETLSISAGAYIEPAINIRNVGPGILYWNIASMPEWLEVDTQRLDINSNSIIPQGGSYQLPLKINPEYPSSTILTGTIILTTNDKTTPEITIVVTLNLGNPTIILNSYNATIDFGKTETTKSISFFNQGNGLLIWSLENLPAWITVSKSSGMLNTYNSNQSLTFVCNRALLPEGQYEAKVILKSNDSKNPSLVITIRARTGNNGVNITAVVGHIVDALYDKSADLLYYVTTKPDKLIAYNINTKTIVHELNLAKAPTCFDISEDGKIAAIGHGGLISAVDMVNFKVIKTFEINTSVFDIAWTKDNLFCYSELKDYSDYLFWIDINSGVQSQLFNNTIDGKTIIKKVPTKPFVIATRRNTSPNGIFVYDILTKTMKSYSHQDLYDFWFVNDGQYVVSKNGRVFRTSTIVDATDTFNSSLNSTDQMKKSVGINYYPIWIDYASINHSIWGLEAGGHLISQFDDTNYSLMKTYSYEDYYRINETDYQVQAVYAFVNTSGNKLVVLRNATTINTWSLEFIEVEK